MTGEPAVAEPPAMKWWGWGDPAHESHLPEHAVRLLERELGPLRDPAGPVGLEEARLRDPALPAGLRERLEAVVGRDGLREDRRSRILHAAGKSYPDLVAQRAGDCEEAPDAVVLPRSHEEVRSVLEACAAAEVAVVPFGGGTSVVGGVAPVRGRFAAVISLDLGRLRRLLAIDERALTAVCEGGLRGPEAEALLGRRGFTLGHFPQSFEYVTIGGCVATRSSGQSSTGYGRIDEMVLGLRCAAPAGDVALPALPASAAGPDLRELLVGSEGTLGVLTEVSLSIRPRPLARRYDGWFFRSFAEGAEALRALEQRQAAPDVARLSDEEETRLSLALAGEGAAQRLLGGYLRLRGYAGGCLAIAGWEGTREEVGRRRAGGATILRAGGGLLLGPAVGRGWFRGRFTAPYLRDDMLGRGLLVETLETATPWSNLLALHEAVRRALQESLLARGTPPLVGCHVSHLYPSGASLYFTWLARQESGREVDQWRSAKEAATDAIVAAGGTLTHHHAVGRDHRRWMPAEVGALGVDLLRGAKELLDPVGVMNPGKLLPGD